MWHSLSQVLLLYLTVTFAYGQSKEDDEPKKNKRAFSVFTIVTFQNAECPLVSEAPLMGVCFPADQCTSLGGNADGNCASGFGVCCRIVVSASGSTVTANSTFIRNPLFPSTQSTIGTNPNVMFTYNVDTPTDVCQIRFDFANFVIRQPIAVGSCTSTDVLNFVSPTGGTLPPICGINNGQHAYIETGGLAADTVLNFIFNAQPGAPVADNTRIWNIRVNMIHCNSPNRAPTDCFQYFTTNSGTVMSYNFAGGIMPNDAAYTTCIRNNLGFCNIQWSQTPGNTFGLDVIIAGGPAIEPSNCMAAFVQIPGTLADQNIHCGGVFTIGELAMSTTAETVVAMDIPFLLSTVRTMLPIGTSFGYSLRYNQVGC